MFAADLRLPRAFTPQQRRERVTEVAESMGVGHILGVPIGDALNKVRSHMRVHTNPFVVWLY